MSKIIKQLTDKEQRFVDEYFIDLDPERAAITAGYSKTVARSPAYRWVSNSKQNPKPYIRLAIEEKIAARSRKTEITVERIEKELALIGFADIKEYLVIGEEGEVRLIPFDKMAAGASRAVLAVEEVRRIMGSGTGTGKEMVLEIKTKYRFHDKVKALELLGKRLGMWKDKVEISGPAGAPIAFSHAERAAKLQHYLTLLIERQRKLEQ